MSLIVVSILVFFVIQQFLGLIVLFVAARPRSSATGELELPHALVVLASRGADSTLADCVLGLLEQDYPDYRIRIVLDSVHDPGWSIVHDALAGHAGPQVEVEALESPPSSCTLKCSAVHQATASLPGDCEVVATLDSDIVPHKTWLRELVAPFADQRIGATVGNRWYAPTTGNWGSWVRYLWNCAAFVIMYYGQVPWGGTLAARASILRDTDLREQWLKAGCEDLPLSAVLKRLKLRLQFVPSLIMLDQGDVSLPDCLRFVSRQLLWTRLYLRPTWWVTALSYLLITAALIGAAARAVVAMALGEWHLVWLLSGTVVGYFVVQAAELVLLESFVRTHLQRRGTAGARLTWRTFLAVPLCQLCTLIWTTKSLLCRRITWRGIEYEIGGRWDIRMVKYVPYAQFSVAGSGQPNALSTEDRDLAKT